VNTFLKLFLAIMAVIEAKSAPASPKEIEITQRIDGEVGRSTMMLADELMASSAGGSLKTVNLLINSPGGSVLAGSVYITAMEVAKARGVKFVCTVPLLAASMAFQILAYCDTRHALEGALFLWHPPRVVLGNQPVTPKDAQIIATELHVVSKRISQDLRKRMPMSNKAFWYHYNTETLHSTKELQALSPGYISIIPDIPGLSGLIPGRSSDTGGMYYVPKTTAPYEIIYIYEGFGK
jgi:ATP-dependent protease ClpP protease subunit